MRDKIGMLKGPNPFVTARGALERAIKQLADPDNACDLGNAVGSMLRIISGATPQIEKDIAKKVLLIHRNKVLAEVKTLIASVRLYEPRSLEHWHQVMELFAGSCLPEDPEFDACRKQLRALRGNPRIDNVKAAGIEIIEGRQRGAGGRNSFYSKIIKEVRSMPHTSSLRAIGSLLKRSALEISGWRNKDIFL